jgi:hypothetical protein
MTVMMMMMMMCDDVLCHAPWTAFPFSCRDDDDVHHGCCVHDAMAPELINIEQRELGASAWAFFLRWDSAQDARERETESPTGMNRETVGRALFAPRTRGGVCVQAGRRPAGVGGGTSLLCAARGLCKGGDEHGSVPKDQAQEIPAMPLVQSPFHFVFFQFFPLNNDSLPKVYKKIPPRIWERESSYMNVLLIHITKEVL